MLNLTEKGTRQASLTVAKNNFRLELLAAVRRLEVAIVHAQANLSPDDRAEVFPQSDKQALDRAMAFARQAADPSPAPENQARTSR